MSDSRVRGTDGTTRSRDLQPSQHLRPKAQRSYETTVTTSLCGLLATRGGSADLSTGAAAIEIYGHDAQQPSNYPMVMLQAHAVARQPRA